MSAAEKLLREAVPHAEWREKRIYGLGPQVYQSWLLEVQLLIPADSGMRPEQALDRALDDGLPTYSDLVDALRRVKSSGQLPPNGPTAEHINALLSRIPA